MSLMRISRLGALQRGVRMSWHRALHHTRAVSAVQDQKGPPSGTEDCGLQDGLSDIDDPSGDKAVYEGILATQIKLVKSFSLMTSAIGLAFQPVLYFQAQTSQSVGVFVAAGAFFSFFTFATPLLVHSVSKKYVTKLYYDRKQDAYTAVTYSLLVREKKLKFKVEDVHVPDIPGMFTTFKAHNVPLFVDGQMFESPKHFGKIMGYEKPIDLRWDHGVTKGEARTSSRDSCQ